MAPLAPLVPPPMVQPIDCNIKHHIFQSIHCMHTYAYRMSKHTWNQLYIIYSHLSFYFCLYPQALSAASVTVYRSVRERFHPSSLRPHHSISMHHLLTVFEGLLLLTPDTKAQRQFGLLNRRGFLSSVKTPQKKHSLKLKSARKSIGGGGRKSSKKVSNKLGDKVNATEADSTLRMLVRLWCHETTRVYLDRNTDSKERIWFLKLLESCIKYCFCGVKFEEGGGGGGGGGGLMSRDRRFRQGTGGHTASFGKFNLLKF